LEIGDKIMLPAKFLSMNKNIDAFTYPTRSADLASVTDLSMLCLGYKLDKSVLYAFRDVEYSSVGGMDAIDVVNVPTIDFFSYTKGQNMSMYYVILYNSNGEHVFQSPRGGSLILANIDNPDFDGDKFDTQSLKDPQPRFLESELQNKTVKLIDKLDVLRKLETEAFNSLSEYKGSFEDLIEDMTLR
jgi:hypothetical protein